MKRVLLTAPGIFTDQNDPLAWFRQYASRFELEDEADHSGAPYVYYASAFGGPATIDPMADAVAEIIATYNAKGATVDAAGHSHGCAILLAALMRHPDAKLRTLTLIAAAADVDCDKNGLNEAARRGQIELVQLLYSRNDTVLAGPGSFPGYGQLGLGIVKNPSQALGAMLEQVQYEGNHSDYFDEANGERTYQLATVSSTAREGERSSDTLPSLENTPEPRAGDGTGLSNTGSGLGLQSDGGQG